MPNISTENLALHWPQITFYRAAKGCGIFCWCGWHSPDQQTMYDGLNAWAAHAVKESAIPFADLDQFDAVCRFVDDLQHWESGTSRPLVAAIFKFLGQPKTGPSLRENLLSLISEDSTLDSKVWTRNDLIRKVLDS